MITNVQSAADSSPASIGMTGREIDEDFPTPEDEWREQLGEWALLFGVWLIAVLIITGMLYGVTRWVR
jgi:hypothetical protein